MSAEDEAWSSGESEPDEQVCNDTTSDCENELDLDIDEMLQAEQLVNDTAYTPSVKDFIGPVGVCTGVLVKGDSPYDFFEYFFDQSFQETIIIQTNLYQEQNPEPVRKKMKPWTPLVKDEFRKFLGLSIDMGHVRKGDIKDYWSTDVLLSTPIFGRIMSRNRFLQILRYLHFFNNEETSNCPLKKIKPVIEHLQNKFSHTIHPGKNLCIDESLLLWKGRLKFKQFLPLKRNRFGIKLFELVDCDTGFLLAFVVYTGSDTDYEKFGLGVSGDIVAHFMTSYFHKGHIVFIDNWYSSPKLAEFLHDRETGMCGTVKKNRKGMPELNNKLSRGEIEVAHNSTWLVIKWMDKKEVFMITTVHEVGFCSTGKKHYHTQEDIVKPSCIHDYNKNMGGIDNIDRQLSLTETVRKTMKWYRKLFFHLIDLMLTNAHVLFKIKTKKTMSFPDFRFHVARALLNLESEESLQRLPSDDNRLRGRHFPKKIVEGKQRQCLLCSMSKRRRRSIFECATCRTPLCVDPCFEVYHTKLTLP